MWWSPVFKWTHLRNRYGKRKKQNKEKTNLLCIKYLLGPIAPPQSLFLFVTYAGTQIQTPLLHSTFTNQCAPTAALSLRMRQFIENPSRTFFVDRSVHFHAKKIFFKFPCSIKDLLNFVSKMSIFTWIQIDLRSVTWHKSRRVSLKFKGCDGVERTDVKC